MSARLILESPFTRAASFVQEQRVQMMICGFRKRGFFIRFLVVLVLSSVFGGVNALTVVRNDVDTFSNPDAASCSSFGCIRVYGSGGCKGGNCCICKCTRNAPNYLIYRKACVPNDEVVGDCDFSSTSSEIAVVDISKAGNVQFQGDAETCSSGLHVMQWSYRLDTSRWIKGQPNNFTVNASFRWSLQWNTGLDAKYSGLILKFDVACAGFSGYRISHCLLVKSKGNYTLSEAPYPPLQAVPSDVAAVDVTGRKVEPTERSERNDTVPGDINDVDCGETAAETKRETEEKNNSVVAVGVCLSLVAGVALICVVVQ